MLQTVRFPFTVVHVMYITYFTYIGYKFFEVYYLSLNLFMSIRMYFLSVELHSLVNAFITYLTKSSIQSHLTILCEVRNFYYVYWHQWKHLLNKYNPDVMLNAFVTLLYSKVCWYNRLELTNGKISHVSLT